MGCTTSSVEAKRRSSVDNAFKTNIESATSDSLKDVTRKLAMAEKKEKLPVVDDDKHSMIVHQDELRIDSAQTHQSSDSGISEEFSDTLFNKENQLATMNEQDIVDQLKKEGLLRPDSTKIKAKSMSFEVPLEELKVKSRRPPTRLAKLNIENGSNTIITTKMENAERLRLKLHNERATLLQKKSVKLLEMHLASIDVDEDLKSIKALSST